MQANQSEELEIVRLMRALGPEWQGAGQPKRPAQPTAQPPVVVSPPPVTNQSLEKIHQFLTTSHALVKSIRLPGSIRNLFNCENSPPATPLPGTRKHWHLATAFSTAAASVLVAWAALNGPGTPAPEPEETATASVASKVERGTGEVRTPPTRFAHRVTQRLPLSTARASIAPGQGLRTRATRTAMNITPRPSGRASIDPNIYKLIRESAHREQITPELVERLIGKESGFKTNARSDTGAAGLIQFTKGTFLGTYARHSDRLNFTSYSLEDMDYRDARRTREKILRLRDNISVAIPMGTALTRDNYDYLQKRMPYRPVNFTDIALAHFMGPAVAIKIILMYDDPKKRNEPAWKQAEPINYQGETNRNVFFTKDGKARSIKEVYETKRAQMGGKIADGPAVTSLSKPSSPTPE